MINKFLIHFLILQAVLLFVLSGKTTGDAVTLYGMLDTVEGRGLHPGQEFPYATAFDVMGERSLNVGVTNGHRIFVVFVNCPCQSSVVQDWIEGARSNGETCTGLMARSAVDTRIDLAGRIHDALICAIRADQLDAMGKSQQFPEAFHVSGYGVVISEEH